MVEDLYKYSEAIEQFHKVDRIEKKCSRTVELFFSFDIVNSSLYKDINYLGWQCVLTELLSDIQKSVTKEIPGSQLWRVLGDEIIFFVTIRNIEEVYIAIDSIYHCLVAINKSLKNETFFEKFKYDNELTRNDIEWMKKSNILAVQSAAWIAIIFYGETKDFSPYDNVFKIYNINDKQQIYEFLGQDIDIGFRIKKETQDRRLVVSIELAKILSDKTEYLSRLRVITYKNLKGVWRNRLYPIIWYHDSSISNISFEDSFYYDENTYSQLSNEFFINSNIEDGNLKQYMYKDVHRALEKVIKDQRLDNKLERIKQVIDETENDEKTVENEFDSKLLEFHCAAVCCDTEKRKILIAKRKNRTLYTGFWEFGCAKASIEKNLCDSIVEDYKDDFGIDIEIMKDDSRKDIEPIPVAVYQIDKGGAIQKGVIVIARILGNIEKIEETIEKRGKHEAIEWISEEDIDNFNDAAINDFKNTLKKVFSMWKELFGE